MTSSMGGRIRIRGTAAGDRLCFEVEDNGKGMSPRQVQELFWDGTKGIGLKNIRKRLALIYGDGAQLDVRSEEGKGTLVTISIPCETGKFAVKTG